MNPCSAQKYPQPKGQKKKKIVKYGMGGLIIFFLICIIWFPLLFISLVRSVVGVVNHPIDVTVTVKLGGYEVGLLPLDACVRVNLRTSGDDEWCVLQPLFTMSVQQQSIKPFTELQYESLTKKFGNNAVCTRHSFEMVEGRTTGLVLILKTFFICKKKKKKILWSV